MMKNYARWMVMGYLLLSTVIIRAQQLNETAINNILLHSIHNNNNFSLKQLESNLAAIVFLSPECPISQNYTLTLGQLQQEFAGKLTVIGIFPGSYYKNADYLDFEKKYHVTFRLLKDENKSLTKNLGATITPQVFLINSAREIVYSGAIDDWAVSLGKMRRSASTHYLKNAVERAMAGLPAEPIKTKAVGCFIN